MFIDCKVLMKKDEDGSEKMVKMSLRIDRIESFNEEEDNLTTVRLFTGDLFLTNLSMNYLKFLIGSAEMGRSQRQIEN